MNRRKTLCIFALILGIGAALSQLVLASDTPITSSMTNYVTNARTAEDHEYIAALFELRAVKAQSMAESYTDRFNCWHSQATALQRRGVRFPGVVGQRHCRAMMRHYDSEARQLRARAAYHRRIADQWRAHYCETEASPR
jgi:hypothetical protein